MKPRLAFPALVTLLASTACTPVGPTAPTATATVPVEAPDPPAATQWLCRPDRAGDPCLGADLDATVLRPDGTRAVAHERPAAHPSVDCFYVYPTVDLRLRPGNHEDLGDDAAALRTTLTQVGRFGETCALWVPLYRQVTLGTYLRPAAGEGLEHGLDVAFSDVERAFREYLAQSGARKIVLVGHSQGAAMIVRLLRRFFDHDPAMQARLLLAMPIGGVVTVPIGATTGGTFDRLPICTRAGETGCVVAYRTFAAGEPAQRGREPIPPGQHAVCVDPAALDAAPGGSALLSRAYFPLRPGSRRFLVGVDDVTTPFIEVPAFYAARCVAGPDGYDHLEVSDRPPPGDPRTSPVDFARTWPHFGKLGLHVLDMQLAQGDLIDLIARRAPAP
jgi:hypothetical protein